MEKSWEQLDDWCLNCNRCQLSEKRQSVVIDRGSRNSKIMFIGEGPGEQEDIQGKPFVGPAGKLLDKILVAAGFDVNEVYIANIVKCRPPFNRDPLPEEREACINYLRYQTALIKPEIIVCLGRVAAQCIIDQDFKITRQRGQWVEKKDVFITATFHPSALLRDESKKPMAWQDFKEIRRRYTQLRGEQQFETN